MLAENINGFIEYVYKSYQTNNTYLSHPDKLYRLKLLIEEFEFRIIASELLRINRFEFDEKYTSILVNRFRKAIGIIGEYIDHNENDLFIFTPRLHTLRSISSSFSRYIMVFSKESRRGLVPFYMKKNQTSNCCYISCKNMEYIGRSRGRSFCLYLEYLKRRKEGYLFRKSVISNCCNYLTGTDPLICCNFRVKEINRLI